MTLKDYKDAFPYDNEQYYTKALNGLLVILAYGDGYHDGNLYIRVIRRGASYSKVLTGAAIYKLPYVLKYMEDKFDPVTFRVIKDCLTALHMKYDLCVQGDFC